MNKIHLKLSLEGYTHLGHALELFLFAFRRFDIHFVAVGSAVIAFAGLPARLFAYRNSYITHEFEASGGRGRVQL